MIEKLNTYNSEIVQDIIENAENLEKFRLKWLSKKGIIPQLFEDLKKATPEEKRALGQQINNLKKAAEAKFESEKERLEQIKLSSKRDKPDLTLEGMPMRLGSLHPLTIVRNRMVKIFSKLGFVISEGPEVVDDWHNFTALNMPEDHPARDMQDTFFINLNPVWVLRTHTSSVQVKVMQSQKPPIRTIAPGRVFRKDSDATHSPVFHQIEGLYIDKKVSFADLKQTLYYFVGAMFGPDTKIRFRPSYFPFTEPSAEMDILQVKTNDDGKREEKWLEVLGCGMVDPAVLENCGIDSNEYRGFAFGIGIERIAMVKYGIPDIRLFYENDMRFLSQFKYEII